MTKVFLFGIDGATPELLFGAWKNELPHLKKLMEKGSYAKMNSTIPPITIVAWNAMISGKDPSEIGLFGYTFKDDQGEQQIVTSKNRKCEVLWDILGREKKQSIALYVPLTYPVHPLNGCMVSDFLTPTIESECTYPPELKEKIKGYGNTKIFFDVVVGLGGHKSLSPQELIERTYTMTEMQIKLLKDLLVNKPWDFFMTVMLGTDRLQHMLWNHFDKTHRRYVKDSPHKNALKEYYIYLDKKFGEILSLLDEDTIIIVASDHGMVKQEGKININNWLNEEGYLVFKKPLKEKTRFHTSHIDMNKTLAWGSGAYHGRIFINKEKAGNAYGKIREEIIKKLKKIPDDQGKPLKTTVYKAEEIYKNPKHPDCPDLTVYFDDLRWSSNPDLGQEGLYSWETALRADSAGHARQGCFIIYGKGIKHRSEER